MADIIEGGCYCGDIRFAAEGDARHSTICHCRNCRRAAGAQSVAFVTVPAASFRFTRGLPTSYTTDTKAVRTFCGRCGSSLTYIGHDRKEDVDIHTASLDEAERFPASKDFFVEERLFWVPLVQDPGK